MATASGIRAGRAYVELFADDSRLVAGLRSAQRRIAAFGALVRQTGLQLATLGAGVALPLGLAAKAFADAGSQLHDLSARTGASVESLSELGYAAGQTGASLEDVEKAMRVMQKTVAAAQLGSDSAAAALGRVGLSAEALAGSAPDQQFLAIAQALESIVDPGDRAAAALAVFGKAGTNLLPMIGEFSALRDEARRLGLVMSTTQANAADALGDAFDRLGTTLKSVAFAIGGALAPTLTAWSTNLLAVLLGLRDWIAQNQQVVVTMLSVGAALLAAGTGLVAMGAVVGAVSTTLGALVTLLGVLGATIGALLTPIAGVILGMTALGAAVATQTQIGQQALGMLRDGFQTLALEAVEAWTGIADALAAGNIELAARVVWTALQLEWQRGSAFLLDVWDAAVGGFAKIFATTWFGLQDIFWTVVHGISEAWDWVVGGITKLWNDAVGGIASRLASLLELVGLANDGLALEIQHETLARNETVDQGRAQRSTVRDQSVADLADQRDAIVASIDDHLVAQMQGRDAEVERARAAFTAALAEASQQKQAVRERAAGPNAAGGAGSDLDALRAALDRLPDALDATASKLDVSGSFTASTVGLLGVGDSAPERTAKASEETARNTKRLLGLLDEQGLEFG